MALHVSYAGGWALSLLLYLGFGEETDPRTGHRLGADPMIVWLPSMHKALSTYTGRGSLVL